jgi:hypothetical protein
MGVFQGLAIVRLPDAVERASQAQCRGSGLGSLVSGPVLKRWNLGRPLYERSILFWSLTLRVSSPATRLRVGEDLRAINRPSLDDTKVIVGQGEAQGIHKRGIRNT